MQMSVIFFGFGPHSVPTDEVLQEPQVYPLKVWLMSWLSVAIWIFSISEQLWSIACFGLFGKILDPEMEQIWESRNIILLFRNNLQPCKNHH